MKSLTWIALLLLSSLLAAALPACKGSTSASTDSALALCGDCGQLKGGESCCAAGAADCPDCGLDQGAPGCCKMTKGSDAALCADCGMIKGGEGCCAADAAKCEKCGKIEGSPGCCKA